MESTTVYFPRDLKTSYSKEIFRAKKTQEYVCCRCMSQLRSERWHGICNCGMYRFATPHTHHSHPVESCNMQMESSRMESHKVYYPNHGMTNYSKQIYQARMTQEYICSDCMSQLRSERWHGLCQCGLYRFVSPEASAKKGAESKRPVIEFLLWLLMMWNLLVSSVRFVTSNVIVKSLSSLCASLCKSWMHLAFVLLMMISSYFIYYAVILCKILMTPRTYYRAFVLVNFKR